jgi:uncharacterized protein (TIGR02996 family)
MPAANEIDVACTAIDADDFARGLKLLLKLWRGRRARELADVIERVSPRACAGALDGKTLKERHARFVELAQRGDPATLHTLLPALGDGKSPLALDKLDALDRFDADPRIGRALTRLFLDLPYQGLTTRPFWSRLFQLIVVHGDPLARELLASAQGKSLQRTGGARTIADFFEASLAETIPELDHALGKERSLDGGTLEKLQALGARLDNTAAGQTAPDRARDVNVAFAAVYSEPASDAARAVLADVLLEVGDPRGELIALQQASEPRDQRRINALLKKHGKAWLGKIGPVLAKDTVIFERGFPAEAYFFARSGKDIVAAIDAPEWGTMRALFIREHQNSIPGEIVRSARALRVARDVSVADAAALFGDATAHALEELGIGWYASRLPGQGAQLNDFTPESIRAIGDGPGLPKLQTLAFNLHGIPAKFEWLFDAAIARRLRRVEIEYFAPLDEWTGLLERAPSTLEVAFTGRVSALWSGGKWKER